MTYDVSPHGTVENIRGDIIAARLRKDAPCVHCGELIAAGELVHRLGTREAAHVACGLRARRAIRFGDS